MSHPIEPPECDCMRRYATADVFTERALGGNPVAVVLDAHGLSAAQMLRLAGEFNYVETTFVLPPRDPTHTARVRIFTPDREVPFAGHPTIGTSFVLARGMAARGEPVPDALVLEVEAGLVPVALYREADIVVGAEATAPEAFRRGAEMPSARAAALLSLDAGDVRTDRHPPLVASVGLPFLVVELASLDALGRARPERTAYDAHLPLDGAWSVYAYARAAGMDVDLRARMFTRRMIEDPATGSASAAATALLAEHAGAPLDLRIAQGVEMGRPSLILTRAERRDGAVRAHVGGRCAPMFEGHFHLAGEDETCAA